MLQAGIQTAQMDGQRFKNWTGQDGRTDGRLGRGLVGRERERLPIWFLKQMRNIFMSFMNQNDEQEEY